MLKQSQDMKLMVAAMLALTSQCTFASSLGLAALRSTPKSQAERAALARVRKIMNGATPLGSREEVVHSRIMHGGVPRHKRGSMFKLIEQPCDICGIKNEIRHTARVPSLFLTDSEVRRLQQEKLTASDQEDEDEKESTPASNQVEEDEDESTPTTARWNFWKCWKASGVPPEQAEASHETRTQSRVARHPRTCGGGYGNSFLKLLSLVALYVPFPGDAPIRTDPILVPDAPIRTDLQDHGMPNVRGLDPMKCTKNSRNVPGTTTMEHFWRCDKCIESESVHCIK